MSLEPSLPIHPRSWNFTTKKRSRDQDQEEEEEGLTREQRLRWAPPAASYAAWPKSQEIKTTTPPKPKPQRGVRGVSTPREIEASFRYLRNAAYHFQVPKGVMQRAEARLSLVHAGKQLQETSTQVVALAVLYHQASLSSKPLDFRALCKKYFKPQAQVRRALVGASTPTSAEVEEEGLRLFPLLDLS